MIIAPHLSTTCMYVILSVTHHSDIQYCRRYPLLLFTHHAGTNILLQISSLSSPLQISVARFPPRRILMPLPSSSQIFIATITVANYRRNCHSRKFSPLLSSSPSCCRSPYPVTNYRRYPHRHKLSPLPSPSQIIAATLTVAKYRRYPHRHKLLLLPSPSQIIAATLTVAKNRRYPKYCKYRQCPDYCD